MEYSPAIIDNGVLRTAHLHKIKALKCAFRQMSENNNTVTEQLVKTTSELVDITTQVVIGTQEVVVKNNTINLESLTADLLSSINATGGVSGKTEEEGFDPFTNEAYAWVMDPNSIPGAFAPILYFGPHVAVKFSKILGRPITLDEAKIMAYPDGLMVTCTLTGKQFQPVGYIPFCNDGDVARQVSESNDTLGTISCYNGGQFYLDNNKEMVPVSGAVYIYDKEEDVYRYDYDSPLVQLAMEGEKQTGKKRWGMTIRATKNALDGQYYKEERQKGRDRKEMMRKASELANRLFDKFEKKK